MEVIVKSVWQNTHLNKYLQVFEARKRFDVVLRVHGGQHQTMPGQCDQNLYYQGC